MTRESGADPNVTSDASETVFWYFGRNSRSTSIWNYLGLAPVLVGMVAVLM